MGHLADRSTSDMVHLLKRSSLVSEAPPRKRGRKTQDELLREDGHPFVAVMVGSSEGRWRTEFGGHSRVALRGSARLAQASGVSQGHLQAPSPLMVLGVVVFQGWHFVLDRASHVDTYLLMDVAKAAFPRRREVKFLEHMALSHWQCIPFAPHPTWSLQSPTGAARKVFTDLETRQPELKEILNRWTSQFGTRCLGEAVVWHVWWPLASALSCGAWAGDVAVRHRRVAEGAADLPVQPSTRLLTFFMGFTQENVRPPHEPQHQPCIHKHGGAAHAAIPTDVMLAALQFGEHLKDQSALHQTFEKAKKLDDVVVRAYGLGSLSVSNPKVAMYIPRKSVLRTARVRLDCGAMLSYRETVKHIGYVARYLACDASPQGGMEIFATVERVASMTKVTWQGCFFFTRSVRVLSIST